MSEEYGIERYVDLAKAQTKAKGPTGVLGPLYGPNLIQFDSKSFSAVVGSEIVTSDCAVEGGLLRINDLLFVEWWGMSPDAAIGYDLTTIKMYWNNVLLGSLIPATPADTHTFTITELPTNYITFSTYPAQHNNIYAPNWRQSGGNLKITVTSSINQILSMSTRILWVAQ